MIIITTTTISGTTLTFATKYVKCLACSSSSVRRLCVRGAPWSPVNRLHGQRIGAYSWRPVLGLFHEERSILARLYPELLIMLSMLEDESQGVQAAAAYSATLRCVAM